MKKHLVEKIQAYLEGTLLLAELVSWAEDQLLTGFEADPVTTQIVFRLGTADAQNFDLSWEELAKMLHDLGYKIRLALEIS